MKYLIALALLLTGCAHSPFVEPMGGVKLMSDPCGPNECGKPVVWIDMNPGANQLVKK